MKTQRGKFITIEGCEGVGKSTQIGLLRDYCAEKGIDAVFTREPGGTPIAEKIRAVILDASNAGMDAITELMLYTAARRQHTAEMILPALNAGKTVFCDRYADSTLAYQGYGRGVDKDTIRRLNAFAADGVTINCTVFLNLNPRDGFLRKGGRDMTDRLEREDADFHERVYQGFLAIQKSERGRFVSIDASAPPAEIHAAVIAALRKRGVL